MLQLNEYNGARGVVSSGLLIDLSTQEKSSVFNVASLLGLISDEIFFGPTENVKKLSINSQFFYNTIRGFRK